MIALLLAQAQANEFHVVRAGDTVESIASQLGFPALAPAIRELNAIADGGQPTVGAVLEMPEPGAGTFIDRAALVVSVSGTATAEGPKLQKVVARRGLELPTGATICTEKGGFATIRLAVALDTFSHDDISLFPETCMRVDSAFTRGSVRSSLVTVDKGGVTVTSDAEVSGVVTVRTPDGLTTGDKGGYRVHIEDGASRTEAVHDAVAVIGNGEEVTLDKGQGTRVQKGKAPQAPIDLIPGVTPLRPEDENVLRHPDFYWEPVERALGYRIELAVRHDFTEIIASEEIDVPEWHPEFLFLPFRVPGLWWRVASFDRTGFLGVPSEPRALNFPKGVGP